MEEGARDADHVGFLGGNSRIFPLYQRHHCQLRKHGAGLDHRFHLRLAVGIDGAELETAARDDIGAFGRRFFAEQRLALVHMAAIGAEGDQPQRLIAHAVKQRQLR